MRKELIFLTLGIFLIGFVFASGNGMNEDGSVRGSLNVGDNGGHVEVEARERVMNGNYTTENGERLEIREQSKERTSLMVGNCTANCDCNLTEEQFENRTRIGMELSNGRNAEIKIMPDTASETAIARLRIKACSKENNCSIELREIGSGNQTRAMYEIKAEKESKVFGLFRAKMKVQSDVDAENGEVIRTQKPWWAFLATESEE